MISLRAKNYSVKLIWQCPKCKECITTNIYEIMEQGIPLCKSDHPGLLIDSSGIEMKIVSYLVSDISMHS